MRDRWNNDQEDEHENAIKPHSNSSYKLIGRGGAAGAGGSKERHYCELDENGEMVCRQLTSYECKLEDDVEQLQDALFRITSHYAKIQFRLRQIATASGCERMCLLKELERMTSQDLDNSKELEIDSELPSLASDSQSLGNVRVKQHKILTQLRGRLQNLADAAGICFQTETGGCCNLSRRCVCQQKIKQGVKLPHIFDDDGNLIQSHDQDCLCCSCRARLDQQGRGLSPMKSEAPPLTPTSRRYLSETWSDTDYGMIDMEQSKSKIMKKKKTKSGKKKSSSRSRRQSQQQKPHVEYDDFGSAGDQKSVKRRSSKQRQSRASSRTPSERTPSRGAESYRSSGRASPSQIPFTQSLSNSNARSLSSLRLPGQASVLSSSHPGPRPTPLLPDYSKSEPLRRRSSAKSQRTSGETRISRCSAICRTNRSCQRPKEEREQLRGRQNYSESEPDTDKRGNTQADRRGENEKPLGRGHIVHEKSRKHLFNQIIEDNLSNNSSYKPNEEDKTFKKENQSPSKSSHGIACTCCSCSRRMTQDFGIPSPERPSTSGSQRDPSTFPDPPNQNKPIIVVKSCAWKDLKQEQKDK